MMGGYEAFAFFEAMGYLKETQRTERVGMWKQKMIKNDKT